MVASEFPGFVLETVLPLAGVYRHNRELSGSTRL